jgi:hypothetical protein
MRTLAQWLHDANLAHRYETLLAAGVDLDVIGVLSDADFKELGIELGIELGDRRRLQRSVHTMLAIS